MKVTTSFISSFVCVLGLNYNVVAQTNQTDKQHSASGYEQYWDGLKPYNIGPTIMSGRVVDIDVDPNNTTHFYVAFATGGLWETTNNGISFTCIFNQHITFGIGDVAIDWETKTIYVGTGENNSSRSSYAGKGVLVSTNNGKTWASLGLEETQHIGRIVLNPKNPNEIWVGAIGHLFTHNKERGVYKTIDGGKTWKQVLFIDEKTGVIDLVADPQNANTLYAAAWQRERVAWNFEESGSGSGIFKSTDGGETWKKISTPESKFPQGNGVGRIGLAVSYQDSNVLYAFLDNQEHEQQQTTLTQTKLTKEKLRTMDSEQFLKLNASEIEEYLRGNHFPEKYTATHVVELVKAQKIKPLALVEYLEDANSLLFDTPIIGAELYRSNDGGSSWTKTHEGSIEGMVFTYGYYFGQVRVHPKNHDKIYLAAFLVANSTDGGKTFQNINGDNVHVDHHALWIDPNYEGHLINGNDGGVNISYDNGKSWSKCINTPTGQFYTVAVDNATPYNVYGGLQDNGVWYAPHTYTMGNGWQMSGKYPYQTLMGGDGMQVQVDPRNNDIVYTGYQFGNYFRINKNTGQETYITPKHELGERPLRFNWQAPIHLSVHQNDVLYIAANKVYRSFNQGENFTCISPDLTTGGKKGDVAYSTITALNESPMRFGLLYAGTDDGLVHVSKDGGSTWENITQGLPQGYWVRRVVASSHNESKVYVCLSGHTRDEFESYLFVSENYGKTWQKLTNGLPQSPVNVIREDSTNQQLLYVGTDIGLYISINAGTNFFPVHNGLPMVPVHDLAVQNYAADLVIATHGRSLFLLNIEQLRQLVSAQHASKLVVLPIEKIRHSDEWGSPKIWYDEQAAEPTVTLHCFNDVASGEATITLIDNTNEKIVIKKVTIEKGLKAIEIPLAVDEHEAVKANEKAKKIKKTQPYTKAKNGKYYMGEGTYTVSVAMGDKKTETKFEVVSK